MAPAFFDLSARTKLRVTGADRIRFLNGQTTNDVRKAGAEAARAEAMKRALAADYRAMDESEWEVLRIESGIPRWGCELTREIIPPEANLAARAIDYEKGCYIGQEVISRMKMSGQTRQRLCGLTSEKALAPGKPLHAETMMVGHVTSAVFSERLNAHIALAIIKRGYTETGTSLITLVDDRPINVKVVALPFSEPSSHWHGPSGGC